MDVNSLINMLTEGLPADQAAVVKAAIERDAVKGKVTSMKGDAEYQNIQNQMAALQTDLEGDAAKGKLGAKAYQKWYDENIAAVTALQKSIEKYKAKFGDIDVAAPPNPNDPNARPSGRYYTEDELNGMFDRRFQEQFAPRVASVLKNTAAIMQKHLLAGRKSPVDMEAIDTLMKEKNLPLETAYEEWDKPERERLSKEETENEIKRRVDEEVKKRNASVQFPGAHEQTGPSTLSTRSAEDKNKFNKTAFTRDLASTFVNAGN